MNKRKYPFKDFEDMFGFLDRPYNGYWADRDNPSWTVETITKTNKLNYTSETKDGVFSYHIEVPGLTSKDIKVSWDCGELIISGKSEKFHKTISYKLPMFNMDIGTLKAVCVDGMLIVSGKIISKNSLSFEIKVTDGK